jgi:hypothetical protein
VKENVREAETKALENTKRVTQSVLKVQVNEVAKGALESQ